MAQANGKTAAPDSNREMLSESSEEEEPNVPEGVVSIDSKKTSETEAKRSREIYRVAASGMENSATFNRIMNVLSCEVNDVISEFSEGIHNSQDRFRFFERMDDALEQLIDVNEAHLAVLRHNAIQLSQFAPLEALDPQRDIPVEDEELLQVDPPDTATTAPPRKLKRKQDDEPVKAPRSKKKEEVGAAAVSTRNSKTDAGPLSESKKAKSSKSDRSGSTSRKLSTVEVRQSVRRSERKELSEETNVKDDSDVDMKTAEEDSDDGDSKDDAASDSTKSEPKRTTRRTLQLERHGGSDKNDKSRRQVRQKRSRSPELEKPRRRAAAMAAAVSVSEAARPASLRRSRQLADPAADEDTYCSCQQVSYGPMIACENSNCEIEWFHFNCVDIKAKPAKGVKWYCPTCRGDKSTVLKPSLRR